jgi:hypothetical protein
MDESEHRAYPHVPALGNRAHSEQHRHLQRLYELNGRRGMSLGFLRRLDALESLVFLFIFLRLYLQWKLCERR